MSGFRKTLWTGRMHRHCWPCWENLVDDEVDQALVNIFVELA